MFSLIQLALLSNAIAAPTAVDYEAALARRGKNDWWSGLEPYDTYHTRYLLNGCSKGQYSPDPNVSGYWYQCCQPLMKDQTADVLPSVCRPGGFYAAVSSSPAPAASSDPAPAPAPADTTTTATPVEATVAQEAPAAIVATSPVEQVVSSDPAPVVAPTTTEQPQPQTTVATTTSTAPSTGETYSGHATYFYQNGNPGACGNWNSDSTPLIALDYRMYRQDLCGKGVMITRTSTGAQVYAIVADMCPSCISSGSIDLSTGAFNAIAQEWEGMVDVTWTWA